MFVVPKGGVMDYSLPASVLVVTANNQQSFWSALFKNDDPTAACVSFSHEALSTHIKRLRPALIILDPPETEPKASNIQRIRDALRSHRGFLFIATAESPVPWLMSLPTPEGWLPKSLSGDQLRAYIKKQLRQCQAQLYRQSLENHRCVGQHSQKLAARFVQKHQQEDHASVVWLGIPQPDKWRKLLGIGAFYDLTLMWFKRLRQALKNLSVIRISETTVMVLAPTDHTNTSRWFSRLQSAFQQPLTIGEHSVVTGLCGVAFSHFSRHPDAKEWLKHGERSLLKQQTSDDETNKELHFVGETPHEKRSLLIKAQLQQAINDRRFRWLYQPFVSQKEDNREKYQLMMRIITTNGSMLAGKDYLDAARNSGLLETLDHIVLEQAINWLQQAREGRHYCLLINQGLNAYLHHHRDSRVSSLVEKVSPFINPTDDCPSHQLVIQFDVQDAIVHMAQLDSLGKTLRHAGIAMCLSGFSGASEQWRALEQLQADWVRTPSPQHDPTFFTGGKDSPCAALITQAHAGGQQVFVPQVDTMKQTAQLWTLGVDYLQGHFIQPPTAEVDFSFSQQSL